MARARALSGALPILLLLSPSPAASSTPTEAPLPFIRYNRTLLEYAKTRVLAGDAELLPAYTSLINSAEASLSVAPVTIVSRPIVNYSTSSDPHIYQSFATYFWPCTFCCPLADYIDVSSNGPQCDPTPGPCNATTGLPFADCDGLANDPLINAYHSPLWSTLHGAVPALGLAYFFTGDERYASHAADMLRVWFLDPATFMRPTLEYAQSIPGVCTGRPQGIIEFSSGGAFVAILDAVTMLNASSSWTSEDQAGMVSWAAAFLEWLRTGPTAVFDWADEPNNHRTWINALMLGTSVWLGNATEVGRVVSGFPALMDSQISPDGELHFEAQRSKGMTYSTMCLRAYLELAAEGAAADPADPLALWNLVAANGASVRAAVEFLAPYIVGTTCWFGQQYTGYDFGSGYYDALRQAAVAYDDPSLMDLACQVPAPQSSRGATPAEGGRRSLVGTQQTSSSSSSSSSAAAAGPYLGDLSTLLFPFPPRGDVVLQEPYCATRGLAPRTGAPVPGTVCAAPTGIPQACNFPPSSGGPNTEDADLVHTMGGIAAVAVAGAVLYSQAVLPWLKARREKGAQGGGAGPASPLAEALLR